MNVFKKIFSNSKTALFALSFAAAAIFAGSINANPARKTEPGKDSIVGVWQLNRSASDKSAKKASAKDSAIAEPVLFAPESLIVAADENTSEITINEGFEKVIHTQTFSTDGSVMTKTVPTLGQISAKAFWANQKLVVEISTSRGDKVTETFELSSNQKRLSVTLQFNDSRSVKPVTVKRVYNRMPQPPEERTAEIVITDNPF